MEASEDPAEVSAGSVGHDQGEERGGSAVLHGTWRRELAIGVLFLACAVLLTAPIAWTLNSATGLRGDYFNNIWNVWWVQQVFTEGESLWSTEHLYYPLGLSLKRHTLSLVNAFASAPLRGAFGPHAVFNILLIVKFALAGWTFSLFARYLTGSTLGAILGGLVWSFCPFHYYYICQVNVFTFEWVPLALLFFAKSYSEGGRRNVLLAALFCGLIAATTSYYVVYTYMVVGLFLVAGRLFDRKTPWKLGMRRLVPAAVLGAAVVIFVAFPLVAGALGGESGSEDGTAAFQGLQKRRANDLFGYYWLGGPEEAIVSWPTMLGYSTLLLLAVGFRGWVRRPFWILVGGVFLILSLGKSLSVGMEDTGVWLPYDVLGRLPVLEMLRKPDRAFLMIQFVVALFVAGAWGALAGRLKPGLARVGVWLGVATLIMTELTGVPFSRFEYAAPAYMEELARRDDVETVLELPVVNLDVANARYNFFQTTHEKKQPVGYCTALALTPEHNKQLETVIKGYLNYVLDRYPYFKNWIENNGIDAIVHHKTEPHARKGKPEIHKRILWKPFFLIRRELVDIRQIGGYLDEPIDRRVLTVNRGRFSRDFGRPAYEDDEVIVWFVERD